MTATVRGTGEPGAPSMPFAAAQKVRVSVLNVLNNSAEFGPSNACSLSTSGGAYSNITNASMSFTKILSATQSELVIDLLMSAFTGVAADTNAKFGVLIDGTTDVDIVPVFRLSTINNHEAGIGGAVKLTGLAAGSHTFQLRAARVSGSGTVTIDSNDFVSFKVRERLL